MKYAIPFLAAVPLFADLVAEVRSDIAQGNFKQGEQRVAAFRKANGASPEMILALSWLGRGAQAARKWDDAERFAAQTRELCLEALKMRKLDEEPRLPTALGASIEVAAHTMAARGGRSEAVAFLQGEVMRWHATSIRARTQKNLHLLSLEGKPAPKLELAKYLGPKPPTFAELKGRPVLLFFWAHWCSDCKSQGPVLSKLQQEFASKGLVVMGPTQRYGYIGSQDVGPEEEIRFIDLIRQERYGYLEMACPVSEENFKAYGSSSSPTLVVIDRAGAVALYHPGKMTYEELLPVIRKVTGS
ncbi:MAG: TlpA disulfide reductase family protein [Bryobacteraceae bacterium]